MVMGRRRTGHRVGEHRSLGIEGLSVLTAGARRNLDDAGAAILVSFLHGTEPTCSWCHAKSCRACVTDLGSPSVVAISYELGFAGARPFLVRRLRRRLRKP
jgi:hypothetical protein